MKPTTPEPRPGASSVIFAKDQPQYIPLPANVSGNTGYVETKWKLNWKERWQALVQGTIYLTVRTFNQPLQPIRGSVLRARDYFDE